MPNQKNLPTEEELAVLAANGDDESMALLISAVTPIAKAKAISFATVGISDEDLLQEGMLGFLDAVRSFDPSKEIRFRTFAEACIHNRIVSAVRVHFNNKNAALSNALPFEPETADIGDSDADPANIVTEMDESEHLENILLSGLSEFEKQVVNLRLQNNDYSQIASALNCSKKAVDNALQRIRKKMRKKLNK